MKIRLEHQKTSIRLSKAEFEQLGQGEELADSSTFPNGNTLSFMVRTNEKPGLKLEDLYMTIELPSRDILAHTPDKRGLSYYFQLKNDENHELLFEVDIKKKPLGSRRSTR